MELHTCCFWIALMKAAEGRLLEGSSIGGTSGSSDHYRSFFSLSFSGFPILAQAGLFAGMGIGFSFLFVHWLFPLMIPMMPPAKRKNTMPLQQFVNGFALKGEKYKLAMALGFGFGTFVS
jgi:hypothetical protein